MVIKRRPIRVVIVEPDPTLRELLNILLAEQRDLQIVAQATDGREALAAAKQLRPDIVFIDDAIANPDCVALVKALEASAQVIVVGSYPEGALDALAAGASDYVLKDSGSDGLVKAIRRAMLGFSGEPGS
ncbi:MAG: response regulator [Dehalococcoidia bacterium]